MDKLLNPTSHSNYVGLVAPKGLMAHTLVLVALQPKGMHRAARGLGWISRGELVGTSTLLARAFLAGTHQTAPRECPY